MQTETDAPRKVSSTAATALVVANMIGTGIFVTSGFMARDLGHPWVVLLVWALGGLLSLCGASVYAELGGMMPRAGGEYVYLSRAFNPAVGFLSGWVSLLVGFSAPIAAAATAFAYYVATVWPSLRVDVTAASIIVVLSLLHMGDVARGARVQTLFTALKVSLLLAFAGCGLAFGDGTFTTFRSPAPLPGASSVAVALVFVSFAYSGWNAAAYLTSELKDPRRTLPRALLSGTATVLVLYVLVNVALFYAASPAELGRQPEVVADVAARALFGARTGHAVSLAIAVALVSSISAMIMAGPRVPMAMAEDGLFFAAFARRGPGGAPWVSVAVQAVIAVALVFTAAFETLLTYIGFTLSAFSALTVLGAWRLRRREPDAPRPYRAFGWPVTPALFVALSLWIVAFSVYARPMAAVASALTLGSGLLVYAFWSPSKSAKERDHSAPRARSGDVHV